MKNFTDVVRNSYLFKKGLILFDFPLKEISSFKIGGNAEFFFEPITKKELSDGLNLFFENNINLSIIGGANNLLISDNGISGLVLSLKKMNNIRIIDEIILDNDYLLVEVGAGVLFDDLTEWCIENSISGVEDFGGLPATVGGACFMNARCYGLSISDILYSVEMFSIGGSFSKYSFSKNDWDYKKSPFQKNSDGIQINKDRKIILSATLKLKKGTSKDIETLTNERKKDREKKGHYKAPSAGSTFKNNRAFGHPSGKIIEDAGLKGYCIGGAQVAPWHGNFIINQNNASFDDVLNLVHYVQNIVNSKTGFLLEPEVIICGNRNEHYSLFPNL